MKDDMLWCGSSLGFMRVLDTQVQSISSYTRQIPRSQPNTKILENERIEDFQTWRFGSCERYDLRAVGGCVDRVL